MLTSFLPQHKHLPASSSLFLYLNLKTRNNDLTLAIANLLSPKSASWHMMSYLGQNLVDLYEFLPPKLSCKGLLIESIELCSFLFMLV